MSTKRFVYLSLLGAAALTLVGTIPAAAHVTVQPGEATKGGYTKLAFRVPNESSTAGTVKLQVTFPQDTPLTSARTKPMPGWTAEVTRTQLATPIKRGDQEITEAISTITWTAQPGVRIGPDEFTEFEVSTGPLPDADRLLLPAQQTYDDGRVVDWNAPPPAEGAEEPEHPAPVLTLTAAEDTEDGHGHASAGNGTDTGASAGTDGSTTHAATATSDDTARWLGGAGLAVGALGLGIAIGLLLARRRGTGRTAA